MQNFPGVGDLEPVPVPPVPAFFPAARVGAPGTSYFESKLEPAYFPGVGALQHFPGTLPLHLSLLITPTSFSPHFPDAVPFVMSHFRVHLFYLFIVGVYPVA